MQNYYSHGALTLAKAFAHRNDVNHYFWLDQLKVASLSAKFDQTLRSIRFHDILATNHKLTSLVSTLSIQSRRLVRFCP